MAKGDPRGYATDCHLPSTFHTAAPTSSSRSMAAPDRLGELRTSMPGDPDVALHFPSAGGRSLRPRRLRQHSRSSYGVARPAAYWGDDQHSVWRHLFQRRRSHR
eukprot:3298806-Heterocapsa_arctica.AAC.1